VGYNIPNENDVSKANYSSGQYQRGVAACPLENSAKVDPIYDFSLVECRATFDPNFSPKHYGTFDPPTSVCKFKD